MVPDPDLQLSVSIKALRDVVAPAIDPANALAAEQLHLAMVTLEMVRSRLPHMHRIARQELENAISMATAVDIESRLVEIVAGSRDMLANPAINTAYLDTQRLRLLEAVSAMFNETQDPARRTQMTRAVVAQSKSQCDLARALSLQAGFEPDPADVPELENLL